jgi:aspartate racemase
MHKKTIGILGGVGPYAGLDLIRKIFDNTCAENDYEHLPVILYSVPQLVPDRTDFITGRSTINPSAGIIQGLQNLAKAGAHILAVACNNAHADLIFKPVKEWVEKHKGLELVNIVDSTVEYILNVSPSVRKAGILAVYGTYKSQVYEKALLNKGIEVIGLTEEMKKNVHNIIWNPEYGIKAFSSPVTPKARNELLSIINYMIKNKADAIILACTEIPLAITEKKINNVFIVDSNEILARKLIMLCDPGKLKPI